MSIENLNVIDLISIDKRNYTVLTISDHLDWDEENNHLFLLQEKLNLYLHSIEEGSLYEQYPEARGKRILIQLISNFFPNDNALSFLANAKKIIENEGYSFEYRHEPKDI